MPLSVKCPACQAKLSAPDSAAGKRVKCPKCQAAIAVPATAPAQAAAATIPKPAALPPMPAAQAKPAADLSPRAVADGASAQPNPPFAVTTASPKPAPKARGGLPVLLIVLGAVVVGGGGLFLVVLIGVTAFILLRSGEAKGPAANRVAVAAPAAAEPRPDRNSSAPAAQGGAVATKAASNITWVVHEDSAKSFKAAFPGQPQPLDPLADIKDPDQRELAAIMMKEMTMLGANHGGRKYILSATPFSLSGMPVGVYFDRMSGGLTMIHPGFEVEMQPSAGESAPQRDYVLKRDGAGKLLRVVVGRDVIYQLLIEGEAGLAFSDPAAKEFFERFEAAGVSGEAVASSETGRPKSKSKSKSSRRPSEPNPEVAAPAEGDGIDWRPFQGNKIAFTINFPGRAPEEADPLAVVPERFRAKHQERWTEAGFVAESFAAQVGDRRYAVTAFHNPNPPAEGSSRFISQMASLTGDYARDAFQEIRGRGLPSGKPLTTWQQWITTSVSPPDGSKVILRRAQLGHYGFVVWVAGPATMDDLDPQVYKFFDDLLPPPDAAPLPPDPPRPKRKSRSKPK